MSDSFSNETEKNKSVWKEYLTLSMRERRGLSVLLGILLSQLILLFYLNTIDLEFPFADQSVVNKLYSEISDARKNSVAHLPENKLTLFDPNQTLPEEWVSFGLSEKQANSVLNYRKKGGKFRTKKDIRKIYGMNEDLYELLLPYIDLPDTIIYKNSFAAKPERDAKRFLLDINKADSVELEKLRGIGFTLAARIVKYRERLGGFIDLSQLREVWGLNDTLFQLLSKQITLNRNDEIRYLHLNTDSFSVFSMHPYIGKKLASMIINYRKQHNSFIDTEDLRKLPLVTDENFRKLAPYLKPD